jgi:hypothetical protein
MGPHCNELTHRTLCGPSLTEVFHGSSFILLVNLCLLRFMHWLPPRAPARRVLLRGEMRR